MLLRLVYGRRSFQKTLGKMAGALGFEPRSSVLETDSLTVELTPLWCVQRDRLVKSDEMLRPRGRLCLDGQSYLVSLCAVCLRQRLQNFLSSRRPVVVFLFFVVE
jgi:hypothetical protein